MDAVSQRLDTERALNRRTVNNAGSASSSSLSGPSQKVLINIIIPDHEWKFVFRTPINTLVRELLRRVFTLCRLDIIKYINYGLFLPPNGVQKGKFLQEERLLTEYPQLIASATEANKESADLGSPENGTKSAATLMLIRKCRFVDGLPMNENRYRQVNSKAQQKHFLSAVRSHNMQRIEFLLDRGLDPNFQYPGTGDTPLCCAVALPYPQEVILKLVEKGAHLEFRDADTLTPLHRAAMEGKLEAIKVLLNLGLNPNVRDSKDLTPLYRAVSLDVPVDCISILLYDHAILGVMDDKNRQEIHQACLFDHPAHLEQLILYGADLNAQTTNLDTPLHICALNNHEQCLRLLLQYGANRELVNTSGQTPSDVALLTGLNKLAELIDNFDPTLVAPVKGIPMYNTDKRPAVGGPRAALEAHWKNCALSSRTHSVERYNSKANAVVYFGDTGKSKLEMSKTNQSDEQPDVTYLANTQKRAYYPPSTLQRGHLDFVRRSHLSRGPQVQNVRVVTLHRGNTGFGFQLRGRETGEEDGRVSRTAFQPVANQYFDRIFPNSPAANAGLFPGQYLLEVNGHDVSKAPHNAVTELIVQSGDRVTLTVLQGCQTQGITSPNTVTIVDRRHSLHRPESVLPCYQPRSLRPAHSYAHRSLTPLRPLQKTIDIDKPIVVNKLSDNFVEFGSNTSGKVIHVQRTHSSRLTVSTDGENGMIDGGATPVLVYKPDSNFRSHVVVIKSQQPTSRKSFDTQPQAGKIT